MIVKQLQQQDAPQIAALDAKWFEDSLSLKDAQGFIGETGENTIGLFTESGELLGFATFEILENKLPTDYVGKVPHIGKVLFLGNFTTITNYNTKDSSADEALLKAIESKSKRASCIEIWEALAIDHPYKKEKRLGFDAFGFYENHGFIQHKEDALAWEPNPALSTPCVLFRKQII